MTLLGVLSMILEGLSYMTILEAVQLHMNIAKIDQISSKIAPGGPREAQEGGRQAPRGKNAPQASTRSEYFTKID